jgi:predicted aminopeptidase
MGGGYGGMQLVNSMSADKRKKDIEDEVETARRAYFNALTGKEAAELDNVYACMKQAEAPPAPPGFFSRMSQGLGLSKPGGPGALENAGIAAARTVQETGNNAWTAALLTALGTGALGAKYMYDQTKSRTKAENLMRARNSKARLQELNQTPYVDPDALAALSGR